MIYALLAAIVALSFLLARAAGAKRRLEERFRPVLDVEKERERVAAELTRIRDDFSRTLAALATLQAQTQALEEVAILQSSGFYKPIYDFASSDKYEARLELIRERQKQMLKEKQAATCPVEWQVNGSKAEGKKQISQTLKLMLRAFNGECDAAIAKVNYKNIKAMETRIQKSAETVNGLVEIQQCSIAKAYIDLKLDELHLAHEYQEKLQAEREEQKRIREQMREEETARREMERAKLEAEREEQREQAALRKAREQLQSAEGALRERLMLKLSDLEQRLAAAQEKKRSISQAQLTKAGFVYIISNIGSFGDDVYKIGMTRRLVPQDRIDELGDASVPFEFDVHAIIKTMDAPALENALHKAFHLRRMNRVNERKEFFRVTLAEIQAAVKANHGEFELTLIAEAAEHRKTLAILEEEGRGLEAQPEQPWRESA